MCRNKRVIVLAVTIMYMTCLSAKELFKDWCVSKQNAHQNLHHHSECCHYPLQYCYC